MYLSGGQILDSAIPITQTFEDIEDFYDESVPRGKVTGLISEVSEKRDFAHIHGIGGLENQKKTDKSIARFKAQTLVFSTKSTRELKSVGEIAISPMCELGRR